MWEEALFFKTPTTWQTFCDPIKIALKILISSKLHFNDFIMEWVGLMQQLNELKTSRARCLKIPEKVSFNIASEASYVYILRGQKVH